MTYPKVLRRDMPIAICAEIEWRAVNPKSFDDVNLDIDNGADGGTSSSVAAEFEIEITLTKRRPASWGPKVERLRINEHQLTEDAFVPKTYRVTLERGEFRSREDLSRLSASEMPLWADRFALRLLFDKSPYPPRQEWKQPEGMPDANKVWEWKEFCGRRFPRA
ncbi:hypothetical protein DL764_000641 [Monosporascus ibericus]|uniref:Uncharacterized protein n=1 Tax=Monosporascus ibericus TaxID=155417 RepID=A0A4Q4TUF8_9PEZI|nr:hypothetical protein DL764_000641 [Monosporascus ibericus]